MMVVPGMTEKKIHIMPIGGKNKHGCSAFIPLIRSAGGIPRAGGLFNLRLEVHLGMRLVNGDMNTISDQIMEGMKTAMKAKDSVTLNTLRALKTALTNTAIAKGGLGTRLEEAEELAVVRKQIKQREDSAEQFRAAGRPELAEKEEAEITVLKQFMPAELTAEETAAILETVMKETGASTKKIWGRS